MSLATAGLPGSTFVRRVQTFSDGHLSDGQDLGAPILGNTSSPPWPDVRPRQGDHQELYIHPQPINQAADGDIDAQNPDNHGTVPNLMWRFSDSKTDVHWGGWLRSQVVQDLSQGTDVSVMQAHLSEGAIRESHWHSVVGLVTITTS